jgi:RNA polymerase-binding transcription factor DksA
VKKAAPVKKAPAKKAVSSAPELPKVRGRTKDGIAYTKDFDVKFLKSQRELLIAERARLIGQADQLDAEATSLIEEAEMGDVQFDDEGGEGDTMVVERERDLALSAQARESVVEIDEALARMEVGTYGNPFLVLGLRLFHGLVSSSRRRSEGLVDDDKLGAATRAACRLGPRSGRYRS